MRKPRRPRAQPTPASIPRTARLNELLREILAEELERIDDERLELVTITAVDVDTDLRRAVVYFDSLLGEAKDDEVLEALGEPASRLQAAIGRQARLKRTPMLDVPARPACARASGSRRSCATPHSESRLRPRRRPTTTQTTMPDGLAVVDKPAGWTSHDVVAKARGCSASGRSATPARSTPTPPACCCSAWVGAPGCCASSRAAEDLHGRGRARASRRRRSTPRARSPPPTT